MSVLLEPAVAAAKDSAVKQAIEQARSSTIASLSQTGTGGNYSLKIPVIIIIIKTSQPTIRYLFLPFIHVKHANH